MTLRDPDIRVPLLAWIRSLPNTIGVTEFHVQGARADIAAISPEHLTIYEIKSDVDSPARLERQANAYDHVATRLYLVTTEKKLPKMLPLIPPWWGILLASESSKGVQLKEIRDARDNPAFSITNAYKLLWSPELDAVTAARGLKVVEKSARAVKARKLTKAMTLDIARATWLSALRTRYLTYPELQNSGKRTVT